MSAPHTQGFWMTNHVANRALRPLLRGRFGRRLGRRLAILSYRGRRTGAIHELVVKYVRDGDRVWVMPGQPDRKRWWRNMVNPLPVELWLAGEHLHGIAHAINSNVQPEEVAAALTAYHAVVPEAGNEGAAAVMVGIDIEHLPSDDSVVHPDG